jgi:hypothetical protein
LTKAIIKSRDSKKLEIPDELTGKIYGQVRLWAEGKPTNIWIAIGDYAIAVCSELQAIKEKDIPELENRVQQCLDRAGVKLAYYGKHRSFHVDIHVPKEVVDGYTG